MDGVIAVPKKCVTMVSNAIADRSNNLRLAECYFSYNLEIVAMLSLFDVGEHS